MSTLCYENLPLGRKFNENYSGSGQNLPYSTVFLRADEVKLRLSLRDFPVEDGAGVLYFEVVLQVKLAMRAKQLDDFKPRIMSFLQKYKSVKYPHHNIMFAVAQNEK